MTNSDGGARCSRLEGWWLKALLAFMGLTAAIATPATSVERPNVVFILIDDQRFDAMSALGHPFLETPHLDRLIERGVLFENAFVTTSLCSPSRASILTGQYAHEHGVLDNRTRLDPDVPTFPVELQRAGYRTAFVGKWHMGGSSDEPRPGFDRWVSFPGQGVYFNQTFNVDGERAPRQGYTTDLITDYALEFLADQQRGGSAAPFLLYVSHKAVHAPFRPAERHLGSYAGQRYPPPSTMANRHENYEGKPRWVEAQRRSWHGVDGLYDNSVDFQQFALDYAETMRAVDDSVGRIVDDLEQRGLLDRTLLVFTSDNGFQFGEHGLIDKRTMYDTSIRVPLVVLAEWLEGGAGGQRRSEMIVNLDFAPTFLDAAGIEAPATVQGRSFLGLLAHGPDRAQPPWRDAFLYEYFWERAFPQTPTVLGVRTDRYKLMRFHGIWDRYELYDLEQDPGERRNLLGNYVTRHGAGNVETRLRVAAAAAARDPREDWARDVLELKAVFDRLSARLDELLDETGALAEPRWRGRRRP